MACNPCIATCGAPKGQLASFPADARGRSPAASEHSAAAAGSPSAYSSAAAASPIGFPAAQSAGFSLFASGAAAAARSPGPQRRKMDILDMGAFVLLGVGVGGLAGGPVGAIVGGGLAVVALLFGCEAQHDAFEKDQGIPADMKPVEDMAELPSDGPPPDDLAEVRDQEPEDEAGPPPDLARDDGPTDGGVEEDMALADFAIPPEDKAKPDEDLAGTDVAMTPPDKAMADMAAADMAGRDISMPSPDQAMMAPDMVQPPPDLTMSRPDLTVLPDLVKIPDLTVLPDLAVVRKPISRFPFNEGVGQARDAIGASTAVFMNGAVWSAQNIGYDGKGYAVRLPLPQGGFVRVTLGAKRQEASFDLWPRLINLAGGKEFGLVETFPLDPGWRFYVKPDTFTLGFYAMVGGQKKCVIDTAAPKLNDGAYHHVAVVLNGSGKKVYLYRLGEEKGAVSCPDIFGGNGNDTFDVFKGFYGLGDQLTIWPYPLTLGEVQDCHLRGQCG